MSLYTAKFKPGSWDKTVRNDVCQLCNHREYRHYLSLRDLDVYLCLRCRSTFVRTNGPESGESQQHSTSYSERYGEERASDKGKQCWDILRKQTDNLQGVNRILDIGCGRGDFLDQAMQNGLCTSGIELSVQAAASAALRGHSVVCESAMNMQFPLGTEYDAVTLWDLLEHLTAPRLALVQAHSFLSKGGYLVVLTPMMGSIFDRLGYMAHRLSLGRFDQLARMCWTQDHVFRFDRSGLAAVLKEIGFVDVRVRPIQLLSLRASCYAGSEVMPRWTRWDGLNRCLASPLVSIARCLSISNKLLVIARKGRNDRDR